MSDLLSRRAAVAADMSAMFLARPGSVSEPVATFSGRAADDPSSPRRKSRGLLSLVAVACVAGAGAGLMLTSEVGGRFANPPSLAAQTSRAETSPRLLAPTPVELAATPAAVMGRATPGVMLAGPARKPLPAVQSARDEAPQAYDACDEGDQAACLDGDIAAADQTLRAAYADAIDAGVGSGRLTAARDRWANLRQIGYEEPGRMIDGFADLADRLSRQARAARVAEDW